MEDNASLEKPFKETLRFMKENLNLLKKYRNFIGNPELNFLNEFELLEDKFKKYKDIKRFSIPIIGMISCGKSSFLNFLFGMNCLENGQDVTSKCVVIIRHNKYLSQNEKYIYSVIIKERGEGYYDFEKNEETKSDDVNKIIKERNNLIKNSEENNMPKNEDFFLILEANIPLFKGINEKYGNFFEFLDIPGLDEGMKDSKSYKSSKFFTENILPKIAFNSLFSIFMFDAGKYMRDKNPEIYKNYIKNYFFNNYTNSFFILNKIDLMDDEVKEKKDFENYIKNQLNVNIKDKTIHIEYLSCKNLTKETNKYDNFQSYLKYLLIEGGNENDNLFLYMQEKMVEDFKLDLDEVGEETPNDVETQDIEQKIQELIDENSFISINIGIDDYFNYSNIFNKKIKENYSKKSEKYEDLYNDFNKSFDNSINQFLNIPKDNQTIQTIKNIEKQIDKIMKTDKKTVIKNQKYLDLLYNNISINNIKLTTEKFDKLIPIIGALYEKEKDLKTFQELCKNIELIEFFIKKDKKIRIPLFGGYSTGKSSLLNCIIGKKILPEGNQVTTRKIVIIRNSEKYSISKTRLVKVNEENYNFEDGEIIKDKDTPEKIYQFLVEENKSENMENVFYLLKAPILLFKKINIDKEILNKIEFIDFPGIDVDDPIIKEYFNSIVGLTDTFIFVNESILINNKNNIEIMQRIINRVEERRIAFDYNSCLFVLNKSDLEKNINKENKEKEIEDILFNEKYDSNSDFFKQKENPKISISLFSSLKFKRYIDIYEEIKDFEKFINKVIEQNKNEKRKGLIKPLETKIKNKLTFEFDKNINHNVDINDEYLSKLKNCLKEKGITEQEMDNESEKLNNIIKYYTIMFNNLDKNKFYKESNINSFVEELEKKIIIAKEMTEKQFFDKIKNFINFLRNIFILLQQKSINKKLNNIAKKEQMKIKLKETNEIYEAFLKVLKMRIDTIFKNFLNKIEALKYEGRLEKTKISDIKKEIKQFRQDYLNKIKSMVDDIKDIMFAFKSSLESRINFELERLNIIDQELKEFSLSQESISFFNDFTSEDILNSYVPNYLWGGMIQFSLYSMMEIIDFIQGKEPYIQNLQKLYKDIKNKWDSTIIKCKEILNKIWLRAQVVIIMLYETQVFQINDEKIQELYDKFIQIIGNNYFGDKINGKKHGYGIYTWFDGSKYEGYYKNDLREGFGKIFYADGSKYEGYWSQNVKNGIGRSFYASNNKYEGEFKNNKKEGFGCYIKNDGNIFKGDYKGDWIEGIGIIIYKNGDIYEGEFIKGKRNGVGTYYYKDGKKFEGEWKDSKKNGKGIFYLNEKNIYEGYWEENRRILDNYIENKEYIKKKELIGDKKIKIEYIDGDIYKGEYNSETKIIEGIGEYIFDNGDFYKGYFENNLFSGKGNYFYDGYNIIGIFKNGKPNGECEIIYNNGNKLKGKFKNGKKEGIFLSYNKSKNKEERVMYKNDILDNEFIDY